MRSRSILLVTALLLNTFALVTGCEERSSPIDNNGSRALIFAGGGIGGGTYTTVAGFAQIVMKHTDLKVKVIPGGGLINLVKVSTGEAHLTIGNVPFMKLAVEGEAPFDRVYENFRTIMQPGGGQVVVHFVVDKKLPLISVQDIIELKYPLRVAVDKKGTHDNWILSFILESYGVNLSDLESWGGSVREVGYNQQTMLLIDGHIKGVLQNMQIPSSSLIEASSRRALKFLEFPEDLITEMEKMGWQRIAISSEAYEKIDNEGLVFSVGYLMPIIIHEKVPEDVVYDLTKALCEHPEETRAVHRAWQNFDPRTAWKDTGGELHPGASRYFREKGFLE